MKRKLKVILSVILCCSLVLTSVLCIGIVSAAASVEYFTDSSGNRTGIKLVRTDDGNIYYAVGDGSALVDSAGDDDEFYESILTAEHNGISPAKSWANIASAVFKSAGNGIGYQADLVTDNFDELYANNSDGSDGDMILTDVLSSGNEFSTDGTGESSAYSTGLTYFSSLNAVQEEMVSQIGENCNNFNNTEILEKLTGSKTGFEYLGSTRQQTVLGVVATGVNYDKINLSSSLSSFGLAFYDFQVIPFAEDGVEYITAAEGYDSAKDAAENGVPGVEYNSTSDGAGYTTYATNPSYSDSSVSVSFSETSSVSVSNSMESSSSYTYGTDVGSSTKLSVSVPEIFSAEETISVNFSTAETVATAYGETNSLSKETSMSSTAEVVLPAHTKLGITQKPSDIESVLDYDCPVYVTYKVAMFSMSGKVNYPLLIPMGSMCTVFGSETSVEGLTAIDNLYERAVEHKNETTFEKSQKVYSYNAQSGRTAIEAIDWPSVTEASPTNGFGKVLNSVEWLNTNIPLSAAGATLSVVASGVKTDITSIEPLYELASVRVVGSGAYTLAPGGKLDLNTVSTEGFNKYNIPYYGYISFSGSWSLSDENGNDISSVTGVTLSNVSNYQVLTANELGEYYLKFSVDDTLYDSVSENVDTPIIKVSVTKTGQNHICTPGEWKTTIPATCFIEGEQVQNCSVCGLAMNVQKLEKVAHTPVKITTPATCVADGSITEICGICNATISSSAIPATGHDEGIWKIDFEATADHNGQMSRYCTKCGEILETKEFELHTHQFGYESITREPTCTENGEKGLFCSICNVIYATEQIEKSGHGATTAAISVQPTCTTDGEEKLYCTDCGMLVGTNIIPAKGHGEGVWIASVAPTCTQAGEEICICTACDTIIDAREVEALGHDDGVWKIDFEATFDHNGQMSRYCSKCNEVLETKEFAIHEHILGYEEVIRPATCVVDGLKGKFCSICGACYETEAIPATGHGNEIALITILPTCTTDGEKVTYCVDCGMKLSVVTVAATGHDDGVWKVDFEATPDHNGQMTRYCSKCDELLESKEFELHTHEFGYESITREPTCTQNGEKSLFCSICGAAYATEQIEKNGHGDTYAVTTILPTCISVGEKTVYCSDCHEAVGTQEIAKTGHDDGVWKVDFEATADHDGQMTKYCSICNAALESKTFELHEHSYTSWRTNNDGTHSRDCYKCGFTESANCNYVATVTASTCTEGGHTTYICADCKHTYIDDYTDALGHDWGEWTADANDETHSRVCKREGCSAKETYDHEWSEWKYNEDGKVFCNGTKSRECAHCGHSETDEAQHTSWFGKIFYPVIVFIGNIVHKLIYTISLNWLFPELTITPKI